MTLAPEYTQPRSDMTTFYKRRWRDSLIEAIGQIELSLLPDHLAENRASRARMELETILSDLDDRGLHIELEITPPGARDEQTR